MPEQDNYSKIVLAIVGVVVVFSLVTIIVSSQRSSQVSIGGGL